METVVDRESAGIEVAPSTVPAVEESTMANRVISGSPVSSIAENFAARNSLVSELDDTFDQWDSELRNPAEISPNDEDDDEISHNDDESEYEYEDDDDAAFSGFLMREQHHAPIAAGSKEQVAPARIRDDEEMAVDNPPSKPDEASKKSKWKEPSKAAVSMSLRAERETSGGKRRLASDLYKIMTADTEEAGFSLAPKSEDSMDNWTIKLFKFDEDSNLHKDMLVMDIDHIELEMTFPDQYPFEPPFVRVVRPRFKRQTGFVMNGALCMELLTKDGWNPVNDIESVIVSVRSLLVVGDARLAAAAEMPEATREAILAAAAEKSDDGKKRQRSIDETKQLAPPGKVSKAAVGHYTVAEAEAAYSHLSDYHKKKGWDKSGWWARKG